MRRLLPIFLLCAFFTHLSLRAQVNMPSSNGAHIKKQVLTTETFYDSGGATNPAARAGITAITFTPKYGQAIEVDFTKLDIKGAKLYVYEGKQELIKIESSDELDSDGEVTYTKPKANPIHTLTGSGLAKHIFHSTTADGALTFVFEGASPAGDVCTATVKSVD